MLTVSQMIPYIKKTTDNLVTVMGGKEAAGEAFNVFQYALSLSSMGNDHMYCLV